MFLRKSILTLAVTAFLAILVLDACAQWSPGGTVVYMGDLNLAGNVGQSESGVYVIGNSGSQLASDVPVDNSPMNNISMNNTSMNNSSISNESVNDTSVEEPQTLALMDLSGYAKNRTNKNLAGYTNIMYPLTESAGFIGTTAGGGGGCGGCS
jgi:hypothetical protein